MTSRSGERPLWRRGPGALVPSLAAACVGALVVGLVEGALGAYDPVQALAAAGYVAFVAVPLGLSGSLCVRGLWRAWQLPALHRAAAGDTGGAPRIAAWISYLLVSAWALTAATFNLVGLLLDATDTPEVIALASALLVVAVAAVLVALSRPVVRALAAVWAAIDRAVHRRWGIALLGPRALLALTLAAVAVFLYASWRLSVRPRIGHLDVDFVYYLGLMVGVVVAVHLSWPWLERRRLALPAAAVAVASAAGCAGAALYLRHQRPYAMLELWGETRIAGAVVDRLFAIESMRDELRLSDLAPRARGPEHPDILLITIDTVRADRTPPHGGPANMPNLERLADAGTVFEWAFAPGNVTRRSLPTIATGVVPPRVRGRVAGWALRLDPRHVTLAERLRAGGYDTAGFFCCESQFGPRHELGLIRGIDTLAIEYDGAELADETAAWLAERYAGGDDDPLFLWMHFIEPHNWVKDVPAERGSRNERYDISLERTDSFIGVALRPVFEHARDRSIIAITSDHGEGLGARGQMYHSTNLHNSQIRVPWVIAGPGISDQNVQRPVSLVDLAPTLMDLAGFQPPGMPEMDGVSLAPILYGEREPSPEQGYAYAVMIADRSVEHDRAALVRGRYKLIEREGDRLQLYDLFADPEETENLARTEPELLERMVRALEEQRRSNQVPPF